MNPGEFPATPLAPPDSHHQARPRSIFPSGDAGWDGAGAGSLLQAEVREEVLAGRDVLSVSKTPAVERSLAYLQPCYDLLANMFKGENSGGLRVLVLVPTREVATRVREEAETLGKTGVYKAASCYHSVRAPLTFYREQLEAITTATILIATPGKLKHLINSGQVDLSQVFYLVLDGADKMVQMGLEPQVRDIIKRVPRKRQSLMFSESLGSDVRKLAKDILSNPRKLHLNINQTSQTERRAVKRPAGSSLAGHKSKMILSGAEAGAEVKPTAGNSMAGLSTSTSIEAWSGEDKEKCLAYFDLCSVSKAEEIRVAVETAEIPLVVRVLRSGVKLVQQSGRIVTYTSTTSTTSSSTSSYPPQVKSKGKKSKSVPPLSPERATSPVSLEDSPGQFDFSVRFTRRSQDSRVSHNTDWVYNYKYKKLYVDLNTWVPLLFNMRDFTRSQSDLQVRVTAVLSGGLSSSSSYPPFHLIRLAEASVTSYQQDNQGRHSVIFPMSSACRKIQFTRLSSDLGREVMVVFSLQDGEGEEVGRRVFSVKIRAGPDNV